MGPVRSGPRRLPRKAASYQDMPTALGELLSRASRNFGFRSQSVRRDEEAAGQKWSGRVSSMAPLARKGLATVHLCGETGIWMIGSRSNDPSRSTLGRLRAPPMMSLPLGGLASSSRGPGTNTMTNPIVRLTILRPANLLPHLPSDYFHLTSLCTVHCQRATLTSWTTAGKESVRVFAAPLPRVLRHKHQLPNLNALPLAD